MLAFLPVFSLSLALLPGHCECLSYFHISAWGASIMPSADHVEVFVLAWVSSFVSPRPRDKFNHGCQNRIVNFLQVYELYLVGLFLLVRDDGHRLACVGQAVIMVIVTVMIAMFQLVLNDAFGPCLRYLPFTDVDNETETENRTRNCYWMIQRLVNFISTSRASRSLNDIFSEMREEEVKGSPDQHEHACFST